MLLHIYGLLTKCEVKMPGYWPSSFSACFWIETKSRSIPSQKRTRPISSHLTEQAWAIKDLLYGFRGNFSCGIQRVVSRGQNSSILPAQVASQRVVRFILPAHGASHIINLVIDLTELNGFSVNILLKFFRLNHIVITLSKQLWIHEAPRREGTENVWH